MEELSTNEKHPIVRIDGSVHRPTGWWTPAVHELLRHLEQRDFPYSPRVRGFDEEGREVLTFIDGESGQSAWSKVVSDDGLARFAALLRAYLDAVWDYQPDGEVEWAYFRSALKPDEIVCHGDFGPWNVIWAGEEPVGIVDWDLAHPGRPQFDVLYAIEQVIPFRDDTECMRWCAFKEPPDRRHRIEVFLDGYGIEIDDVVTGVTEVQRFVGEQMKGLADRGLQPHRDWVAEGRLETINQQIRWAQASRFLFE